MTLTATDGGGLSTSTSFTITVVPPVLRPLPHPPPTVPSAYSGNYGKL